MGILMVEMVELLAKSEDVYEVRNLQRRRGVLN